jgi:nitric-oxide synthase, bacterial
MGDRQVVLRRGRRVGWWGTSRRGKSKRSPECSATAVHSFDSAGVTIADHHTESHRFLTHLAREQRAGRITPADWSWIVPPISGATTAVSHRHYQTADLRPNHVHHPPA